MHYILGVLDTLRAMQAICDPSYAPSTQGRYINGSALLGMAIKYLNEHPNEKDIVAAAALGRMYIQAFPCPDRQ
jgi:hypothetical protein